MKFLVLMKSINGFKTIGEDQFKITGCKFDLVYQWDSCFGFVIIYKNKLGDVVKYLEEFLNKEWKANASNTIKYCENMGEINYNENY